MVAVGRADGVFSKPHEVGKFVGDMVGDVRSVSVTRNGLVIIECKSQAQVDHAVDICGFQMGGPFVNVRCFVMDRTVKRVKGVISGVPVSFDEDLFLSVDGVCGVQRMNRNVNGVKEKSSSVCLTFECELPERIFLDFVCYRVRAFERGPLRCFVCQEYGHVGAVCRGVKRCARCGRCDCSEGMCKNPDEDLKCLHCKGSHRVGAAICPRRIKEDKLDKIRKDKKVTYAEAVKQVEVCEENDMRKRSENVIMIDLKGFLAFVVMVMNGATEEQSKTDSVNKILEAARKFMHMDRTTEESVRTLIGEGEGGSK